MKVRVEPFEAAHLGRLLVQTEQAMLKPMMHNPKVAETLEKLGPAYSVFAGDTLLACGGFEVLWPGRVKAWAIFDCRAGRHFLAIHRVVKRLLILHRARRMEAEVHVGFERGHRWAKMLGFEVETPLARAYDPMGQDMVIYSRIG